jgi:hypothetical protein
MGLEFISIVLELLKKTAKNRTGYNESWTEILTREFHSIKQDCYATDLEDQ